MVNEINRIKANTEYNGQSLFDGGLSTPTGFKYYGQSASASDIQLQENGFIKPITERDGSHFSTLANMGDGVGANIHNGSYAISSVNDLLTLNNIINTGTAGSGSATLILTNDIDMSGIDWEVNYHDYGKLAFYGNGHKISNLNATGNLASLLGDYGSAYDLALVDCNNVSTGSAAGISFNGSANNCYVTGSVSANGDNSSSYHADGISGSGVKDSYFYGTIMERGVEISLTSYGSNYYVKEFIYDSGGGGSGGEYTLQVGVSGDDNSKISFSVGLDVSALDGLISQGLQSSNALSTIDSVLSNINAQQTELGAVQNRLVSAMESISVNIENLTSSRSTLRDADIATVSSQFIQQQILQQAASTLLATANQNPSIALQLI